jgi:acyl-CoA thioester hydrolase
MTAFRFFQPIEVRYGDLDPQGHVNNARYLTYMEQGRVAYIRHLGLWPGGSFLDLGVILADIQVSFLAPILFGDPLRVGLAVTRLGNKSFDMEYRIEDESGARLFATGKSVQVTYNYGTNQTISIPESWRKVIQDFEQL